MKELEQDDGLEGCGGVTALERCVIGLVRRRLPHPNLKEKALQTRGRDK